MNFDSKSSGFAIEIFVLWFYKKVNSYVEYSK